MQCHRKAIVLLAVMIGATGCAKSDHRASPDFYKDRRPAKKNRWLPAPKYAASNIKDAVAPKILPETHFAAGRLFESQGMIGKAIDQYRRAIAVNHHFAEAYDRLGRLLSTAGLRDEALVALRKAVEIRPKDATMRNNLGFELLLAHRWVEAEYELSQAIRIRSDFPRAYINLGIAQSKVGKFNNALESFRRVLPEADAYYNVGLMYRSQNRIDEAMGAFRRAISIDERFVAAKTQLDELASTPKSSASRDLVRRVAREGVAGQEAAPATIGVTKKSDTRSSKLISRSRSRGHGAVESQTRSTPTVGSWGETLARLDRTWRRTIEPSVGADDTTISILENEFNCVEKQFLDETGDAMLVDVGMDRGYSSPADPSTIARAMAMTRSRHDRMEYETVESFVQIDEYVGWCPVDIRPAEVSWIDEVELWSLPTQVVSSADPLALLRELEFQLGIVRNELDCIAFDEDKRVASSDRGLTERSERTFVQPGSDRDTPMGPPSLAAPMGRGAEDRTFKRGRAVDVRTIVDLLNQHSTKTGAAAERANQRGTKTQKDDSRKHQGKKISERSIGSRWMFDQVEGLFGLTKDVFMRWQVPARWVDRRGVRFGPRRSRGTPRAGPSWPSTLIPAWI